MNRLRLQIKSYFIGVNVQKRTGSYIPTEAGLSGTDSEKAGMTTDVDWLV